MRIDRSRHGAKQPKRFDPKRAGLLGERSRFEYLQPGTLLALLDLLPAATLLDFGAGTGLYAIELASARLDVRVLALDEQPEMLALLRGNVAAAGRTNLEVLEPAQLEGLGAGVDRVLALNVLHELGDTALAEVRRLLAPAGKALFVDWNAEAQRPVGPPREHVYSPSEAERRLEASGFAVTERSVLRYHYAFVTTLR
ncbi:MAG: class I SAM-dependent methyltransferase [Vulcanimicrobiaceae bacterium]